MASNLELIGINERSGLITPNLYKQDWAVPSSLVDNYSVLHTRALSDTTTPIYGKGTGIFLDTTNGGGEYDINGNPAIIGSGRNNAISINTIQWSYGPITPYSVINTRALSDTTTPIYGKGTGIFLDTTNGGGEYDINGNQINFPGSGRGPLMAYNYSIWTFGTTTWYSMTHQHALAGTDVHGKGTNDGMGVDGTYAAHTNYAGGSSDDVNTRNSVIFGMNKNLFVPNLTNTHYTMTHPNALAGTDEHGKGTNDSSTLNFANDFVLVAHTNYLGGSSTDVINRNKNILDPQNTYWVDTSAPLSNKTNWYTMSHPNALAGTDVHGKGTNDAMDIDGTYAAHMNYKGGSNEDIILGREFLNTTNFAITLSSGNHPFGYGYKVSQGYDSSYPICSNAANTINVGAIHW